MDTMEMRPTGYLQPIEYFYYYYYNWTNKLLLKFIKNPIDIDINTRICLSFLKFTEKILLHNYTHDQLNERALKTLEYVKTYLEYVESNK